MVELGLGSGLDVLGEIKDVRPNILLWILMSSKLGRSGAGGSTGMIAEDAVVFHDWRRSVVGAVRLRVVEECR